MATIVVGTHTCDVAQTTIADSLGAYSFTVGAGTISGTIYKHIAQGLPLGACEVHLLQSQSDSTLYCVMAEDRPFWGTRIDPYPLQAAPFTQDLELGFYLNVRFQIDGVYADDDTRLTFVFTGYDADSGKTCRSVWGGGEGVNLLTGSPESAIVTATVGPLAGTVRHYYPAQEPLVFPCGEGALGGIMQRYDVGLGLADYRDDSAETAAAGLRGYITACTMYYSGDDALQPYSAYWDIPLDGTPTVCNYQHSTIHITGQAGGSVRIYARSAGNSSFQDGYSGPIVLDGSGEGDVEDLPAGQYVLLGWARDNGDYSHAAAPVTVNVGWAQTANASLGFEAYEPGDDDLYRGWWMKCPGVPLVGATVHAEVKVWDGEDQVDCYIADIGTTDASGYGPTGHDEISWEADGLYYEYTEVFVDDGIFGGIQTEDQHQGHPLRSLGARVVVPRPPLALLYAGTSGYEHLHGRGDAWHLQAGDYCPAGYTNVRMYRDDPNGWMYSDPVPFLNGGAWNPCEDEDREDPCEWKVYAGSELIETVRIRAAKITDTIHARVMENDGGNHVMASYTVAGRIRGSHVDWSGSELAGAPERPVDLGLEFGAYSAPAFRVIAELHDPDDEDYAHSAGFVAHVCPYCGKAVRRDPADGALRGFCIDPFCGHDGGAYWDVFPAAESDHRLHVVIPHARELSETRLLRQAWYRPEDYNEPDVAYRHSAAQKYRYLAAHIQLGDWDYGTGFSAGTGMAERGVVVDRTIGPAQAKIEVVTAPSAEVEVRVEGLRTDDSHLYYYGTVPASAQAGDIIRLSHVLRTITDPETDKRALARIYDADTEGWPCVLGDAVDSLVGAWAKDSNGDWQATASWLSAGAIRLVNDNPSYNRSSILVARAEVSPYVAHLFGALGQPHLFHDNAVKWLWFVSNANVYWRRDESWEDLGSDDTCKEYGRATTDGNSAWPWADKDEAGRIVLVREYGGNAVYVRISDDNARTWSTDVSLGSGESPRALLHNRRLYVTRISGGMGQVARTPVDDYEQLDTWPDDTTWADVAASDDPVPVDKSESGEVVFAVTSGGAIDIYVSDIDGQSAV